MAEGVVLDEVPARREGLEGGGARRARQVLADGEEGDGQTPRRREVPDAGERDVVAGVEGGRAVPAPAVAAPGAGRPWMAK